MGSIMNGMAVLGRLLPVGRHLLRVQRLHAARGPPRRARRATSRLFVWSHDSVGVGEDGPTHQPVEHLAGAPGDPGPLRGAAGRRQRDGRTRGGSHIDGDGPMALILTRQNLPVLEGTRDRCRGAGPRRLRARRRAPRATRPRADRHRVARCRCAWRPRELLAARGLRRAGRLDAVVGPLRRPARRATRRRCCPPGVPTLAVEAGVTFGWDRWADAALGLDRFGASAPGGEALDKLGFNPTAVAESARRLLA